MTLDREKRLSLAIVLCVMAAQAVALSGELSMSWLRDTDSVNHYTMTKQMVETIERGGNPLDFWSPEISLGVPMVRTYQPLAHMLVAGAYFVLGKSVSVMTLLVWARFLSMLLLPLSFYLAMVLMEFPPLTAAAGALMLPMIAGPNTGLLGMDIRSWVGSGVYPQCVATNLLLASIGLSYRAIRRGRNLAIAGAALGLTCLAHLMYGWMGAWIAALIALLPDESAPRILRIKRMVAIGVVSAVLSLFQLIPLVTDGYLISRSRFEPADKFDSYGAGQVLSWLFSGQIMDHDRPAALTLLGAWGAALLIWRWHKTRALPAGSKEKKIGQAEMVALVGFVFWLLVYFGRATWGVLVVLLGVGREFHLHRVLAAVQIFLLMLAAIGLAQIWRETAKRWTMPAALIVTAVLLAPMVVERMRFIEWHEGQSAETLAAYNTNGAALERAISMAIERGGRVYAGLPNTWGPAFRIAATPVSAFITLRLAPSVSFAYNTSVFPVDVMERFDETNPQQYRLFNIRTVIAPPVAGAPAFLKTVADIGPYRVLEAPGTGYFGVVEVPAAAKVDRENFGGINEPWIKSDWFAKDQYVWLDLDGSAPNNLAHLTPGGAFPPAPTPAGPAGVVSNERQTGQVYAADFEASRQAFALFRMTYHFAWNAYVDGRAQPTVMLTPGFLGVALTPGKHHIVCRYEPGNWKLWLAAAGLAITLAAIAAERNGKARFERCLIN
ncbi:MAG TPA: hypothetical protein VKE70_01480 [Candidatus Solibacter sp.]|nr:hypothetical protein [Candidatus Solibacter sp.]